MADVIYSILLFIFGLVGLEQFVVNTWEACRAFMELGGPVLTFIALLLFVMWALMLERILYFSTQHPREIQSAIDQWEARSERKSWHARQVRALLISDVRLKSNALLGVIQGLVAVCPLLGLLGTVTGMITVFEVMAIAGSGNPRLMAEGVSRATIPTMSGMVAALSGLFLATWLQRKADREVELLSEHLTMDH